MSIGACILLVITVARKHRLRDRDGAVVVGSGCVTYRPVTVFSSVEKDGIHFSSSFYLSLDNDTPDEVSHFKAPCCALDDLLIEHQQKSPIFKVSDQPAYCLVLFP